MARMECDGGQITKRIVALLIDPFQGTNFDLNGQVRTSRFTLSFAVYSSLPRSTIVSIWSRLSLEQQDGSTSWCKYTYHQLMLVSK